MSNKDNVKKAFAKIQANNDKAQAQELELKRAERERIYKLIENNECDSSSKDKDKKLEQKEKIDLTESINENLDNEIDNESNDRKDKKVEYCESGWGVPLSTEYINDKKMDYETLSLITLFSNYKGITVCDMEKLDYSEIEYHRYIYQKGDNSVYSNMEEMEKLSQNKRRNIKRNIKKLVECDNKVVEICKDKNDKIYYKINPYACDGNKNNKNHMGKFVTIDSRILEKLLKSFNNNAIKVYCVLCWCTINIEKSKELGFNVYDWKQISQTYMLEQIGLSGTYGKNTVMLEKDIIEVLEIEGFISRQDFLYHDNEGQVFKSYKYKINTYEDYVRIHNENLLNARKVSREIENENREK